MGNQTTVIIRNDAIDEIRRNPEEFVSNLLEAIERVAAGLEPRGTDFGCGCHANPARVVEVHHADNTTIVACGGSTAEKLATIFRWRWSRVEDKFDSIIGSLTAAKAMKVWVKEQWEKYDRS